MTSASVSQPASPSGTREARATTSRAPHSTDNTPSTGNTGPARSGTAIDSRSAGSTRSDTGPAGDDSAGGAATTASPAGIEPAGIPAAESLRMSECFMTMTVNVGCYTKALTNPNDIAAPEPTPAQPPHTATQRTRRGCVPLPDDRGRTNRSCRASKVASRQQSCSAHACTLAPSRRSL